MIIGTAKGYCYLYRFLEADSAILNLLSGDVKPLAAFKMTGHESGSTRISGLDLSFGRDHCLLVATTDDRYIFTAKLAMKKLS